MDKIPFTDIEINLLSITQWTIFFLIIGMVNYFVYNKVSQLIEDGIIVRFKPTTEA